MTSTVSFHFISPQFTFNSGQILFFKGGRLSSDGEISLGEIRDGSIDGVLVEGPLEFDAMLYQLRVTRREDGRAYEIACLPLSRALSPQEISSGRVVVDLHLPVVLVMRVEDAFGIPVPGAVVSFSMPSITAWTEGPMNDGGELVLFGLPGHYSVMLASVGDRGLGRERISADFDVAPGDRGERLIVLRVPN